MKLAYLYWEHQCATFSLPPDTVVYEEDPARAAALLAKQGVYAQVTDGGEPPYNWPSGYSPAAGYDPPPCARRVWECAYPTVFFLHELRSPAGAARLVIIDAVVDEVATADSARELGIRARSRAIGISEINSAGQPGMYSASAASTGTDIYLEPGDVLRMFAGQCIPDDPHSFEIRYELNGSPGVLRATLLDNGEFKWHVFSGKMRLLSEHPLAPHPRVKKGVMIEG